MKKIKLNQSIEKGTSIDGYELNPAEKYVKYRRRNGISKRDYEFVSNDGASPCT